MTVYISFLGLFIQGLLLNILFALPLNGQNLENIKVSLSVNNETFRQTLHTIEQKTVIDFTYLEDDLPLEEKLTLIVVDESLYNVLMMLAVRYDVSFQQINNHILIKKRKGEEEQELIQQNGTIKGIIYDAKTKTGIPGANVLLIGSDIGAAADINGVFEIKNIPAGKYQIKVSAVGYGKILEDVVVKEGKQTEVNFELSEEAVGLDEVVVTGVAFETKRREIPADISVLTTREIEQKNATDFTNLIKGEIPGVLAVSQGQFDFDSRIFIRGSGFTTGEQAKIYIDGVELSDPDYLSTIDPNTIERIEVVRGPHAAALYGAEALAGVIQIITKKGWGSRQLKINALSSLGYIESKYTPENKAPLKSDNSLGLSGGEKSLSYNVSVGYTAIGEWLQHYGSKRLSLSGGLRVLQGPIVANITVLWSNRDYSNPSNSYQYERWPALAPQGYRPDMIYPKTQRNFSQTTIGLNLNYQATSNWVHNLVVGQDINKYETRQPEPYYLTPADTLEALDQNSSERRSIRYYTSYHQPIGDDYWLRFTLGGEYSTYNYTNSTAYNISLNEYGDIEDTPEGNRSFEREDKWTAGYSGVLEAGLMNRLFLTLSSSIKEDPRGGENRYITPPRVGLSYSQEIGPIEIRLRGQYGTAVQPVDAFYITGGLRYGSNFYEPNPDLRPPKRTGWDAGLEMYWGNNASLSFTRFDEKTKDEIMLDYLGFTEGLYNYYQYINLGKTSINGYEIQGKVYLNIGLPISLSVNYSYSDNRILSLSNNFEPGPQQAYEEGDRILYVPKHSGGGSVSILFWRGSLAFNWQFTGGQRALDYIAWNDYRYGSAPHRDVGLPFSQLPAVIVIDGVNVSKFLFTRSYYVDYPTAWKFDLNIDQKVTNEITIFLNVTNLFNNLTSDTINSYTTPGRTTTLGVRLSY